MCHAAIAEQLFVYDCCYIVVIVDDVTIVVPLRAMTAWLWQYCFASCSDLPRVLRLLRSATALFIEHGDVW